MKSWNCLATAVALGSVFLIYAGQSPAAEDQKPEPGKQQPQKLERTVKVTMNYLLYLPKDYDQKDVLAAAAVPPRGRRARGRTWIWSRYMARQS